ncbi:hypothetical protein FJTKL_08252 [Diaporthe vaccinii]|uniref:Uncharacterized protein n=1 Tax=Diaporthe vaccinii TaxID=105482 RepID=A0ABR4ES82_9PEZI
MLLSKSKQLAQFPHTWARTVDQQTRDEVEATLAVGFNKARNSAPHQRNDALREATFQVPHELARLNKDAPDFKLEDLVPTIDGKKIWDRVGERFTSLAPFINFAEEARNSCTAQRCDQSYRHFRGRQRRAEVPFSQAAAICRG